MTGYEVPLRDAASLVFSKTRKDMDATCRRKEEEGGDEEGGDGEGEGDGRERWEEGGGGRREEGGGRRKEEMKRVEGGRRE